MKSKHLLIGIAFAVTSAYSQQTSTCTNADFELNSFNYWVGQTGHCSPVTMTATGIVSGRQTLISSSGSDPFSMGLIPFTPPGGGNYIARLGNSNTGSEAEQLRYTFDVTQATSLFVYRYAVVLEDPGHSPSDQPRFSISVYDQNGDSIPCGTYNVVASGSIPGFVNNGSYRIKPWTMVAIELSSYIGQSVTIEFTTADCGLGGHFGYAYIECSCSSFELEMEQCVNGNNTKLTAPSGFDSYHWNNGETTATISVPNPLTETTFTCTLTSVTGCQITLTRIVPAVNFHAAFQTFTSMVTHVNFIDSSYVTEGPAIQQWLWSFGDGIGSTQQNPDHEYALSGIYSVQLIVMSGTGCADTIVKELTLPTSCYFPNAFTPNGDGRNDFFYPASTGAKVFNLIIFNRFGQVVFNTDNPDEKWNGSFKNRIAPEGTYIYKAEMTDFFNKNSMITGTVSLLR